MIDTARATARPVRLMQVVAVMYDILTTHTTARILTTVGAAPTEILESAITASRHVLTAPAGDRTVPVLHLQASLRVLHRRSRWRLRDMSVPHHIRLVVRVIVFWDVGPAIAETLDFLVTPQLAEVFVVGCQVISGNKLSRSNGVNVRAEFVLHLDWHVGDFRKLVRQ